MARREGLVVAVVGADGSGKSTLSRALAHAFARRPDAVHVYFGSGDGPSSRLRWPLRQARRVVLGRKGASPARQGAKARHPTAFRTGRAAWALALAQEKRAKLRGVARARARGAMVVCDRYPQAQFPGTNDGPLLHGWATSRSRVKRALAAWEARPYELADRTPPDLVLRLQVDQTTAGERRPGHGQDYLSTRLRVVEQLAFPGATFGVVELDATRPYATVLATARKAVEGCL